MAKQLIIDTIGVMGTLGEDAFRSTGLFAEMFTYSFTDGSEPDEEEESEEFAQIKQFLTLGEEIQENTNE